MPEISVIVPVYKVEASLSRCVDSILTQDFSDFELILVDDGSPDGCPAICDEYARKDRRVQVVHQCNLGAGAARNAGIKMARGGVILFCDGDDAYQENAFSQMMEQVRFYSEADIWCFDFADIKQTDDKQKAHYPQCRRIDLRDPIGRVRFCASQEAHQVAGYAIWDKIYRNEFLRKFNIEFSQRDALRLKDDWCEDLYFNLQCFLHAKTIQTLGKPYYLLTTHGAGNGYGVQNRTVHVAVLMQRLYQELSQRRLEPGILESFWRIPVWHLKRYFYADVAATGAKQVRQQLMEHPGGLFMLEQIRCALDNWNGFKGAWSLIDAEDYQIMLRYFYSGHYFWYQLRNYVLWNVKSKWYCR